MEREREGKNLDSLLCLLIATRQRPCTEPPNSGTSRLPANRTSGRGAAEYRQGTAGQNQQREANSRLLEHRLSGLGAGCQAAG